MDNKDDLIQNQMEPASNLNVHAKEFIPKKKSQNKQQENISENQTQMQVGSVNENLNLNENSNNYFNTAYNNGNINIQNMNGYINPNEAYSNNINSNYNYNNENNKDNHNYMYEDEDEENMADKIFSEMEMMEENINLEEEDESDDEKWFPKYRNCECCKGFVYKCEGDTCKNLGKCYCKVQSQIEGDNDDE